MRSSTPQVWLHSCSPHGTSVSDFVSAQIDKSSRVTGNQKRKYALAYAYVWSLHWEVSAIYVPKLCYAALSISQVYLIQDDIHFVQGTDPANTGYGLIGAFAFVYIGLAVSLRRSR